MVWIKILWSDFTATFNLCVVFKSEMVLFWFRLCICVYIFLETLFHIQMTKNEMYLSISFIRQILQAIPLKMWNEFDREKLKNEQKLQKMNWMGKWEWEKNRYRADIFIVPAVDYYLPEIYYSNVVVLFLFFFGCCCCYFLSVFLHSFHVHFVVRSFLCVSCCDWVKSYQFFYLHTHA